MTSAATKRPGKGLSDGVTSELAVYFDVLPGHDEELRTAVRRFTEVVRDLDPEKGIRTGLRDTRHVIFDDGRRLLWCTTFENDVDACIDEAVALIGTEPFQDWMRHTRQGRALEWANPPRLKAMLQPVQTKAAAYFNPLGSLTLTQIVRAQHLDRAFRQVLGNPAAWEVLKHPALRPLLQQAAALSLGEASLP